VGQHDTVVEAPALLDDGVLRITHRSGVLRLAGEADLSHRDALHRCAAAAQAAGPVCIDTASLRYLDVQSYEQLDRFVADHRDAEWGSRSAAVRRTADLCGSVGRARPVGPGAG
jgi:hypothetical protein